MNVLDLDPAAIGKALITLAAITQALGHASPQCTLQDYLLPHDVNRTPEQLFAYDMVMGHTPMGLRETTQLIASLDLPPLPGLEN